MTDVISEALLAQPPSSSEEAQRLAAAKANSVTSDLNALAPRWDVTSSQLKTLSTALITAFTSLIGAIVGVVTGEAVSSKA